MADDRTAEQREGPSGLTPDARPGRRWAPRFGLVPWSILVMVAVAAIGVGQIWERAQLDREHVEEEARTVVDLARWIPLSDLDAYPLVDLVGFALGVAGLA